jgi:hypothetical protein
MSHKNVTKVVWYILVQLSSLNNTMPMVSGVSVQVSAFWSLASRFWLLDSSQGPDTSCETPPGRNSEQIERRTSNVQHRMSNIDDAALYRF